MYKYLSFFTFIVHCRIPKTLEWNYSTQSPTYSHTAIYSVVTWTTARNKLPSARLLLSRWLFPRQIESCPVCNLTQTYIHTYTIYICMYVYVCVCYTNLVLPCGQFVADTMEMSGFIYGSKRVTLPTEF